MASVGPESGVEQTPLMKQYWDLKSQSGDALLLFRMGDFYELFDQDAVEAARILEITLTSRDKNKANPMPMAGVPYHSIQGYIQRLLKAGKKVAIAEQMEDPAKVVGKGIVRREISRVFTPGIQFDHEGSEAQYLAVVFPCALAASPSGGKTSDKNESWVLACLDASTGECLVGEAVSATTLLDDLEAFPIRHLIYLGGFTPPESLREILAPACTRFALVEELPSNYLSFERARDLLKAHYEVADLAAFLTIDAATHALGIALNYALRTQRQERLNHLRLPTPLRQPRTLILGPRSAQHLDLIPNADRTFSLYDLINRTHSALGSRQLKRWLLAPLRLPQAIAARQEAMKELAKTLGLSENLSAELKQIYDLERISGRVNTRLANPRDTLALGKSLLALASLAEISREVQAPLLRELHASLTLLAERLRELGAEIVRTQKDDAPLTTRDGGVFAKGTTPDLDRLISLTEDGERWLIELETRERETTGISSLKVRYNRVFGYYIEVTQAHLKSVPAHYQRKQTTVGTERFFTDELKKFEEEILTAAARQKALEQELFAGLLSKVQSRTSEIMDAARILGEFDSLISLATFANESGWVFPQIDDSLEIEIKDGRHPLVDHAFRGEFVPNDLSMSPETRLALVITGPNMGGKSTVMRQTALIVILGQMGAPVPAREARWGSVSSLYTRIGAHDAIARGQSTFMVEMSELAHILHHADDRSLIILDEIGRGTSTYDGMSVAWSTLEWICNELKSRTLFATHYHELTRLSGVLPRLANAHMAVEGARSKAGSAGSLRFLYKLKDGPTNESFGIHVAKIAGVPKAVIERAWKILDDLENSSAQAQSLENLGQLSFFGSGGRSETSSADATESTEAATVTAQASLFDPVIEELQSTDVNVMTPVQALNFIVKLQGISRESLAKSASGQSQPGQ